MKCTSTIVVKSTQCVPILLALLLCASTLCAQTSEDRMESYIKRNAIDTFMVNGVSCAFASRRDSCSEPPPVILIWKKNGTCFAKKFATCNDYPTILAGDLNPLQFYLLHAEVIDTQEIKPPRFAWVTNVDGKLDTTNIMGMPRPMRIEDGCFQFYRMEVAGKSIHKGEVRYPNGSEDGPTGSIDVNFEYNKNSKLKRVYHMTETLTRYMLLQPALEIEP